jgi:hypothetical protein
VCSGGGCSASTSTQVQACPRSTDGLSCNSHGGVCSAGSCVDSCSPWEAWCNGQCVSTDDDPLNCGYCGRRCATGQLCDGGICRTFCTTSGGADKNRICPIE